MKLFLANYALGRMFLHLGCIIRGGKVRFHFTGFRREIAGLLAVGGVFKRDRN